ncbi:hypothetical protein Q7P35_000630 [Cladosporium inversicolor]
MKLRILALHGFAQNGDMMQLKLKKLREIVEEALIDQYPGGVGIVCPDGVLALAQNISADWSHGDNDPEAEHETPLATTTGMDFRAWWTELDNINRYQALHESLEFLADLLRRNPVDGIIGFSQGATLATMLTSICEGGPKRMRALSTQGDPIRIPPPQAPFKFALLSCGHKGTDSKTLVHGRSQQPKNNPAQWTLVLNKP